MPWLEQPRPAPTPSDLSTGARITGSCRSAATVQRAKRASRRRNKRLTSLLCFQDGPALLEKSNCLVVAYQQIVAFTEVVVPVGTCLAQSVPLVLSDLQALRVQCDHLVKIAQLLVPQWQTLTEFVHVFPSSVWLSTSLDIVWPGQVSV